MKIKHLPTPKTLLKFFCANSPHEVVSEYEFTYYFSLYK